MELRLLGPVEIVVGSRVLDPGPPQRRTVLAVLASTPGTYVSADLLVDRVWGESPPHAARRAIQAHISKLRRLFTEASRGRCQGPRLARCGDGYQLEVPNSAVDLFRFRDLVDRARCLGRAASQRLDLLREALGQYRGQPLAGLSGLWACRTREVWRREHLDALLNWADVELLAGNHMAVVRCLTEVCEEYPLVEPLAAMFIRALAAGGYTSLALDRYAQITGRLATELGIDPTAELRRAHHEVLRGVADEVAAVR
jgi:DNA-binding SARP family transcriptional activator